MTLPDLLHSNTPSLSEQLKCRTDALLSRIVRANKNTKFAQTVPELTEFRQATADLVGETDNEVLSEVFRKTVPLTTYDAYAPLLARLSERPCKASAVADLLAPGLPDYIVKSSSTSGGLAKVFPVYNNLEGIRSSDTASWTISDPLRRRTRAYIFWLAIIDRTDIMDEGNRLIATAYKAIVSAVLERKCLCLDPEKDEEKMGTFILDHAAPYAAAFTKTWRDFLLIHVLFALSSRSLETMNMGFISTFVDMMRFLDKEFDTVVDCIANGTIPLDLDGAAEIRHYLETNIFPDPERAEELRGLGRPSSQPGWCGRAWPSLHSITAIASGSFASSVPLARWFLGPNTNIHPYRYGSTEARIGLPYNQLEPNQFKTTSNDIVEFLDVTKSDSTSSLAQPWDVELGRRYEVVVTTQNGLWRYRLGDVVEISGFDPTDGVPVIQFIQRRNMVIRLQACMVGEEELRKAMSSLAPNVLMKIVNWTSTIDDRRVPDTIGFFVELADDQVPASDLALVPDCLLEELSRLDENIAWVAPLDLFRRPTIWLVEPGTFSDFVQMKHDEGSNNFGQVKVPVVLPKPAYVTWLMDRVVQEL